MENRDFFQSDWVDSGKKFKLPTRFLMKRERIRFWDKVSSIEIKYGDLEKSGSGEALTKVRNGLKEQKFTEFHVMPVLKDLNQFRSDVEFYYENKIWFLYEWYYPLRIKIDKILKNLKNERAYRIRQRRDNHHQKQ